MSTLKCWLAVSGMLVGGALAAGSAGAATIPSGWTCNGTCGSTGADGVVTLPPNGASAYQWVSTEGGESGTGVLPTGAIGDETNGSTLATSIFSANAGTELNFWFNYVTSDGTSEFTDYGWAALFDSTGVLQSLLFTARTNPDGSIMPGFGMPPVNAVLTPGSVPIVAGTEWSPLGEESGSCFGDGCGHTGWVNASYTIAGAGDYFLEIGAVNWGDEEYQTGLAMSGVTIDGKPIDPPVGVPEPSDLAMFGLGTLLVGLFVGLRRRCG